MFAADLGPYALAIVVVLAVVVVGFGRSVVLSWKDIRLKVGDVHDRVESIDKQVNQVGESDPTLRSVVIAMHSQLAEQRGDIALIKQAAAEAAVHSAEARKVARAAAESTRRNNVLLTKHIAECEAGRHDD